MKLLISILMTLLVLGLPVMATAQTEIVGTSPKSLKQLDLYAEPGARKPSGQISTEKLTFPLNVLKTKSGFSAIALEGQQHWVRNTQVRLKQNSTAKCPPKIIGRVETNSTPGASAVSCR